jgi:hypothetical protein
MFVLVCVPDARVRARQSHVDVFVVSAADLFFSLVSLTMSLMLELLVRSY